MAKKAKVTPTYMKGKRPLRIALHDIARVMTMINQKKQMKRFQTAAKSKRAYVTVDADTVKSGPKRLEVTAPTCAAPTFPSARPTVTL